MADWDQETLERAIAEKHASDNTNKPTAIICKFFLEAVEKKLYGWFWKCPNGGECKYRHALPQGYMLKSQVRCVSCWLWACKGLGRGHYVGSIEC